MTITQYILNHVGQILELKASFTAMDSLLKAYYVVARGLFHNRWGGELSLQYTDWYRPPRSGHVKDHPYVYYPAIENDNFSVPFAAGTQRATGMLVIALEGGYHDAGNWDQHPMHLKVPQILSSNWLPTESQPVPEQNHSLHKSPYPFPVYDNVVKFSTGESNGGSEPGIFTPNALFFPSLKLVKVISRCGSARGYARHQLIEQTAAMISTSAGGWRFIDCRNPMPVQSAVVVTHGGSFLGSGQHVGATSGEHRTPQRNQLGLGIVVGRAGSHRAVPRP